jgi:hypothetical protein
MKPKDVSPEVVTLHRYFIWANRMRTHFEEILAREQFTFEGADEIESFLYIPIRLKQVAQLLREGGGHGRHRRA